MKEDIKKTVAQIAKLVMPLDASYESSGGILGGDIGLFLFKFLYAQWQDKEFEDADPFENMVNRSFSIEETSLCNGHSGLNWFYTFLAQKGIIDEEARAAICYADAGLRKASLKNIQGLNWDVLHGGLGTAYTMLYAPDKKNEKDETYFRQVFNELCQSRRNGNFPQYNFESNSIVYNETNPGLSHGLSSILKFCLQCCAKGLCVDKAEAMAKELVRIIISCANTDTSVNYFPGIIVEGKETDTYSRLAWCYGDLGIGFILYQAGIYFNDETTTRFALDVLLKTTQRRTADETMIYDAGICHGSSGVAHIYNRMWHYTGNPVFKEATDFWIQKTLDFAVHEDGLAGYKSYEGETNDFEISYCIIDGVAGIGLVLLSYLTEDFSWDYCLQLNDLTET